MDFTIIREVYLNIMESIKVYLRIKENIKKAYFKKTKGRFKKK